MSWRERRAVLRAARPDAFIRRESAPDRRRHRQPFCTVALYASQPSAPTGRSNRLSAPRPPSLEQSRLPPRPGWIHGGLRFAVDAFGHRRRQAIVIAYVTFADKLDRYIACAPWLAGRKGRALRFLFETLDASIVWLPPAPSDECLRHAAMLARRTGRTVRRDRKVARCGRGANRHRALGSDDPIDRHGEPRLDF